MEISCLTAVGIECDTRLHIGLHLESCVQDKITARDNEMAVMAETLEIGFFSTIDIQMVGIGGCNHTGIRTQPMERAVKLIGFYHHIRTFLAQDIIGSVILGDSAQESITVNMTLMQNMSRHAAGGGLAMRACHAQCLQALAQGAQNLSTLLHRETMMEEMRKLGVTGRNGRRVYHQGTLWRKEYLGYLCEVVFIMNLRTFLFQFGRQGTGSLVISSYGHTHMQKISGYGTHAYTTYANEIY